MLRYGLLVFLFTLHLFAVDATIKIEKDVEQRARIAIVDGSSASNEKFFEILMADLKVSGHFLANAVYTKGSYEDNVIDPMLRTQEFVLKYRYEESNGASLSVRLLKGEDGSEIYRKSYRLPVVAKMPFLIHKAISDMNGVLKFDDISWINRYVVYVRYLSAKRSEIVLADYTFNYQKVIVKGGLNIFPKWADADQKSFYFTSFSAVLPTLYRLNIYTGEKEKILSSEGMLVCSDVSRDFSKIIVTMAPKGQPDIYEYSVANRSKKQITDFDGIDVNGKYLGDERSIVFVSNRLGYPNVFTKSIDGTGVSPVVYQGRNNNSCDTYDNKVVYAARESGQGGGRNSFNLYLTEKNGADTRPITTTGTNLFPRFSPSGSVILFIKQTSAGSSVGYINLKSYQSLLFPIHQNKIQSIDW